MDGGRPVTPALIIVVAVAPSTVAVALSAPVTVAVNVAEAVPEAWIFASAPLIFPPVAPNVTGSPIRTFKLAAAIGPPRVSVRKLAVSPVEPSAGMLIEPGVIVSVRDGDVVNEPPPDTASFGLGPVILAHQLSVKSLVPPDAKTVFPLGGKAVVLFTNLLNRAVTVPVVTLIAPPRPKRSVSWLPTNVLCVMVAAFVPIPMSSAPPPMLEAPPAITVFPVNVELEI